MQTRCLQISLIISATVCLSSCGTANRLLNTATGPVRMVTSALLGDATEGTYGEEHPAEDAFELPENRSEIMAFTTEEIIPVDQ